MFADANKQQILRDAQDDNSLVVVSLNIPFQIVEAAALRVINRDTIAVV